MKKSTKILIAILLLALVYVGYTNFAVIRATYTYFLANQWLIWLAVLVPIALIFLYKIGQGTELFGKLKLWKWMAKPGEARPISQEKRFQVAQDYLRTHWNTRDYIQNEKLTLVDNEITTIYPKAITYEVFYFTTDKAYADRRIGHKEIKGDKRFFVVVNCFNGECETGRWNEMEDAYNYAQQKTLQSIPKPTEEIPTPMRRIQEEMWRGLGMKVGEQIGEKAGKEEPEKPREGVG